MNFRRLVAVGASGAAVATVLLAAGPAGPAGAAPLDFAPGQKLDAECTDIKVVGLEPVRGNGAFTPYRVSNGQVLHPTSFEVTEGVGLKARHLVPGTNKVSKPGNRQDSATTCTVWGQAYDQEGKLTSFTAVVVGKLTGKPTTSTG